MLHNNLPLPSRPNGGGPHNGSWTHHVKQRPHYRGHWNGCCGVCAFFGGVPASVHHPRLNSPLREILCAALARMPAEQIAERCDRVVPVIRSALGELKRHRLLPYSGKQGRLRRIAAT